MLAVGTRSTTVRHAWKRARTRTTLAPPTPTAGPASGGTVVTLRGRNLAGATAVQFGDSGGSPNIVDGRALGQCGFKAMFPNGDGGLLTAVSSPASGPEGGPGDPS